MSTELIISHMKHMLVLLLVFQSVSTLRHLIINDLIYDIISTCLWNVTFSGTSVSRVVCDGTVLQRHVCWQITAHIFRLLSEIIIFRIYQHTNTSMKCILGKTERKEIVVILNLIELHFILLIDIRVLPLISASI